MMERRRVGFVFAGVVLLTMVSGGENTSLQAAKGPPLCVTWGWEVAGRES